MVLTAAGGPPIDPSDPGYDSTDPNSITDNSVDDAIYINLAASFDVTKEIQVFGSLKQRVRQGSGDRAGRQRIPDQSSLFRHLRRTFRVGARVKF